jgi:hypothetical protein
MEAIELFQFLRGSYGKFFMEYRAFPSGAVMIDIKTMAGMYVVEWSPNQPNEIGISNSKNAETPFDGCDEVFSTFEEAKKRLIQLLQETQAPEEAYGKPRYS